MQNVPNTHSQSNSKPAGGQYTLGTFGYRSFTEAQPAQPTPHRRADDQPRRIGGLSYAQRGAVLRAKMALAAVLARKGQEPALVPKPSNLGIIAPAKADRSEQAAQVAKAFVHVCKCKPLRPGWSEAEFLRWHEERFEEAMAYQARQMDAATDKYEGAGLDAKQTPAMRRAVAEREREDEREWRELADLAACPEWDQHAVDVD